MLGACIERGCEVVYQRDIDLYRRQLELLEDIRFDNYEEDYFGDDESLREEYGLGVSDIDFDVYDIDAVSEFK